MRHILEATARKAGELIQALAPPPPAADSGVQPAASSGLNVAQKADHSPVTAADLRADAQIRQDLATAFPGSLIISEESFQAGQWPPQQRAFFLVDPLDGTKEFIAGQPHYTVNIALIEDGQPTAAALYCPTTAELYSVVAGCVHKNHQPLAAPRPAAVPQLVASRSHRDGQLAEFIKRHQLPQPMLMGSSYKFALLADGRANLYLRFNPTSEWDTAAGQALVTALGYEVVTPDGSPLTYGKASVLNGPFLARPVGYALGF